MPRTSIEKHNQQILEILKERCKALGNVPDSSSNRIESTLRRAFENLSRDKTTNKKTDKGTRLLAMQLIYLRASDMVENDKHTPLRIENVIEKVKHELTKEASSYLDRNTTQISSGSLEKFKESRFAQMMRKINKVHETLTEKQKEAKVIPAIEPLGTKAAPRRKKL